MLAVEPVVKVIVRIPEAPDPDADNDLAVESSVELLRLQLIPVVFAKTEASIVISQPAINRVEDVAGRNFLPVSFMLLANPKGEVIEFPAKVYVVKVSEFV